MNTRVLPFGDRAILAERDSLPGALALHASLVATRPAGVVDLVPAARTVLVVVDPSVLSLSAARAWIARAADGEAPTPTASTVEVPIVYDGQDLEAVAAELGVSSEALVARHASAEWTVAFTGFAPGFGYLVSADWPFRVPRLTTPRTRVPAGAVGLAGEFTGAYPRATPGGWQLIGTTRAALFDPSAAAPALLAPGTRVRFAPASPTVHAPSAREQPRAESTVADRSLGGALFSRGGEDGEPGADLGVGEVGVLATVQDLGRIGHLAEGVSTSGAADRAALRTANRLVGNDEAAAGIEITLGGLRMRAHRDLWVAATGAWGPFSIDGREASAYEAHLWPAGCDLHIGWFTQGARGYLAVRGGIGGPFAVGSRSTDLLAGLGGAPLASGDELVLAHAVAADIPALDLHPWGPPEDGEITVEVAPGPRADWFASGTELFDTVWTVSTAADRVGIRLEGPPLERIHAGELPSEGMLPGAIQVPPDGHPVILGPDGPVTGGYPVIAVVTDATRDLLAQARPGTHVRFRHAH